MAANKKFGTFSGVFTPSILTILGVIMYLRLGWVIGNAGLWGTILIIVIAHIISVTTGLSISSIATDKKVGAGGVYYVLSRSLGLPIGGAIGLTLFVGTALSIALYLVGFAESFNAYLGFGTDINSIRISGTIGVLALATIALISTSVAIKTQYFIMGAILLSLFSIFLGNSDYQPESISFFGLNNGASMEDIFAIFFPAVTGFTAGIAMSGDLQDSKKSIPRGTIAAIAVGFVVYIVLAVFIAYNIDSETLATDNGVLLKMALFAPIVVAGIWGATLSSALGGILGGPRILQAISIDKITPKLFAKGRGKDNEPWNALFLTVVIAECGILIGELNLIARVVSMFYLAAYGFINISFFLESWASADFNPSFKVKKWVGLIGFVATFIVMFKLDMLAMAAAFVIIGGIYFWLQRREIELSSGDIWGSVWNTIIKRGLKRLEAKEDHVRNWKPNMLLFSGGTDQRPYLLEFSKALAGKSGMVTNFDLIENKQAAILFPKHEQAVKDDLLEKYGFFGRRVEVQNIFKGIENIASTFGFSGVEPNTILMGWARQTKDPTLFAQMTQRLISLDYNVLYLDYDSRFGFGKHKTIDLWWRSLDDNIELALNLVKFLKRSKTWGLADIRVVLVNNTLQEGWERRIRNKLDENRINATIKVFNNVADQRSFYDIMKGATVGIDLIIAGIPDVAENTEHEFVENTSQLFSVVGTTLLIKSSSKLGNNLERVTLAANVKLPQLPIETAQLEAAEIPMSNALRDTTESLHNKLRALADELNSQYMMSIYNSQVLVIERIQQVIDKCILQLKEKPGNAALVQACVNAIIHEIEDAIKNDLPFLAEKIEAMALGYYTGIGEIVQALPEKINRKFTREELVLNPSDNKEEIKAKKSKLFFAKLGFRPKTKVPYRIIANFHLLSEGTNHIYTLQNRIRQANEQLMQETSKQLTNILLLVNRLNGLGASADLNVLRQLAGKQFHYFNQFLVESGYFNTVIISTDVEQVSSALLGVKMNSKTTLHIQKKKLVATFGPYFIKNQTLVFQQSILQLSLLKTVFAIKSIADNLLSEVKNGVFVQTRNYINKVELVILEVKDVLKGGNFTLLRDFVEPEIDELNFDEVAVNLALAELNNLITQLPEKIEVYEENSRSEAHYNERNEIITFSIDTVNILSYLIEKHISKPLQNELQKGPQACRSVLSRISHSVRLLAFSFNSNSTEMGNAQMLIDVVQKCLADIDLARDRLFSEEQKFEERVGDLIVEGSSFLNAGYIIEQAAHLESSFKKQEGVNALAKSWKKLKDGINYYIDRFGQLIGDKKDDLIYAEYLKTNKLNVNFNEVMHRFIQSISPVEQVLDKVPFYYQQLFVGKHTPKIEFLFGRNRELKLAEEAIKNISLWQGGALLIIGPHLSGRSFFSEIVLRQYGVGQVIKVIPPIQGSIKPKDFYRAIKRQINNSNNNTAVDDPLQGLQQSTLLFTDIELWWERSKNGFETIVQLLKLIDKYSSKHIIIVNCNAHTYKIFKRFENFNRHFNATVQLSPLSSQSIRKTLISRHQAGGLEFFLYGEAESMLSERKLSKLFEAHSNCSDGLVGSALLNWLSNITAVFDGKIDISVPKYARLPEIKDQEVLLLLAQFVLHKHLTPEKLARIFRIDTIENAQAQLNNLCRSGLVELLSGSVYRINPKLERPICKTLEEYQLI